MNELLSLSTTDTGTIPIGREERSQKSNGKNGKRVWENVNESTASFAGWSENVKFKKELVIANEALWTGVKLLPESLI